jgi:predicted TIM-barrel fold metal-dependent hydrolase
MDDPVGAANLETIGRDTFMWGNDFPHTDSTWPHSRAVIDKNFAGVSDTVAHRVLNENAARLYRIDL